MKRAAAALAVLAVVLLSLWVLRDERDAGSQVLAPRPEPVETPGLLTADPATAVPITPPPESPTPPSLTSMLREPQVLDGELTLDADGTGITGRVLDANSTPVAGARLVMVEDSWGIDTGHFAFERAQSVSEADGSFRLPCERWAEIGSLRVFVAADGWPTWFGRVVLLGGSSDVVLGPAQRLPMRLVAEDGDPVPDAVVRWECPDFEEGGADSEAAAAACVAGRTDQDGRLLLPVFESRRDLSIVIRHDLYTGRQAVPLDAWRAHEDHYEWTLRVPHGAAFELRLTDWPAGWPVRPAREYSGLSLSLAPYDRRADGSLFLREPTLWDMTAGYRGAMVFDGKAVAGLLDAAAYRVCLGANGLSQVLVDPWVPVPGVTSWTCLTPKYVPLPPDDSFSLEVAVVGAPVETVWSDWHWHLVAADRVEAERQYELKPGDKVRWPPFRGPVTLKIEELGAVGVRTDVPPSGHYLFEVPAAEALSVTGGVRADLSGLPRAPRPDETRVVLWPEGSHDPHSTEKGLEAHGIPAGPWRARVEAPWVSKVNQPLLIEPGRTTIFHAAPAPPPLTGRVRGRVDVNGDASWLRVREVGFTDAHGPVEMTREISRLSFGAELQPGSYRGHVTLGQVSGRARIGQRDPDLVPHDRTRSDETPLEADFTCEVTAGACTDVVVKIDAAPLCVLRLALPPTEQGDPPGGEGSWWVYELRREGAAEPMASSPIRSWPESGLLLRLGSGRYTAVADRWAVAPKYESVLHLEGSIEIDASDRERSLELRGTSAPESTVEGSAR